MRRDVVFSGDERSPVVLGLSIFREIIGEGIKMGLSNFLLGGEGIHFISNLKLIIDSRIWASGYSVVVRTGFDSDNISDDFIIEINIDNLLAEIVLDEVGQFLESVVG